jgi:hypothetical protein
MPISRRLRKACRFSKWLRKPRLPCGFLNCLHAALWLAPVADGVPPNTDRKSRIKLIKEREQERQYAIHCWLDGLCGDPVELAGGGIPKSARQVGALLSELHQIAQRQRFLHWQPAFPGVWPEWKGMDARGGFDAVIGNQPWVRRESLNAIKAVLKETVPDIRRHGGFSTRSFRVPLAWAGTQNTLAWRSRDWASARTTRRTWSRRSPPIARRWRNTPATGCRSTGP